MNNKGSDKNVVTEDVNELKRLLYSDNLTQYGKRKLVSYYDKRIQELEEELEKANRQLDLDYVEENFIPKQAVKEKIEEIIIDKGNRYYDKFLESRDIQYTIDILRGFLEGEE